MKWAYDLHIHTAASPCGDENMTPCNIVNMSLLKGLNLIAITDHQTVANCEAVIKVGKEKGLKVLPGMEMECSEEFHMVALFKDLAPAYEMQRWLWQYLPHRINRKTIFGEQLILNEKDEVIGEIDQLLLIAAQVSAYEMIQKVRAVGGLIYPSHIDRNSYSILSNLGSIPKEYDFTYLEISAQADYKAYQEKYPSAILLQSSDAHYLQDISEAIHLIDKEKLEKLGL